jgi:PhnB protein
MALYPYLNFGGNCREAFTRYQEIFGGDLQLLATSDLPPEARAEMPGVQDDLVMHAALSFGDHLLMASDDPEETFAPAQGMHVNYTLSDLDEAERVFTALADGGQVTMPLGETFWSPRFGMCTDRFGTPWMVNVEPAGGS